MRKKKYNLKKYAKASEDITIIGKDGTEVVVRTHIPYADKEEMARELAEQTIVIHDDSCVFESNTFDKNRMYEIAKYYTDIDTEKAEIDEVVDFMINNELIDQITDVILKDVRYVDMLYEMTIDSVHTTYTDDKSLTKALRTSFGFLFTGEDVTESLAKAEAMKDTLYNAIGALRDKEKEDEQKLDNGTLKFGGNILNFAKREE